MTDRCNRCLRPIASDADWQSYGEGEGEHLCWGGACEDRRDEHIAALRERVDRYEARIRAWTDGFDPVALEDGDAIGPPDIQELIDAAPRFRGDRPGGPKDITLEDYEAVVSRSEIVCYARALAWQNQRIAALEAERDTLLSGRYVADRVRELETENASAATAWRGSQWCEEIGDVLWFDQPIDEPPYCGSPLDTDFPWASTPLDQLWFYLLPAAFYGQAWDSVVALVKEGRDD